MEPTATATIQAIPAATRRSRHNMPRDIARIATATAIATTLMIGGRHIPTEHEIAIAQTISEVESDISDMQERTRRCSEDLQRARDELAAMIRSEYKEDEAACLPGKFLPQMMTGTQDGDDIVTQQRYAEAIKASKAKTLMELVENVSRLEEESRKLDKAKEELLSLRLTPEQMDSEEYHYCQWNGSYSGLPYFGGAGTIADSGCGLCSYTSMVNILKGTHYQPDEMLEVRGDWYGCEEILDQTTGTPNGMSYRDWTKDYFGIEMTEIDDTAQAVRDALEEGNTCVIVGTYGSGFLDNQGNSRYSPPHYICAYRCDDRGIYVHDSALTDETGTAVFYTDAQLDAIVNGIAGHLVKCSI